jgi:Uma2 family endonuclease
MAMTGSELPLQLDIQQVHLTDEQFYQICIHNPDWPIECSASGALIVMAPVGGAAAAGNAPGGKAVQLE